jgi:hypothetical protein
VKLVLRKWGGFTGKAGAEVHTIDVDALAPGEAARVRKLVDAARFDALPARLTKTAPQPWDFRHSITIEDGGAERTIEFHEEAAPPELRALVSELAQK